jgi:hypothetical protein
MVEKGDQEPDETPPSSFEDAITPIYGPHPLEIPDANRDDESDDDESEDDDEAKSLATVDTVVVDALNVVGLALYDRSRCLVELSQKVKGHHIYCGHPRHTCPRPKHRVLQEIPGKTGPTGVYQQLPNAKGTGFDAVADTLTSIEELETQRQANRANLEQIGASNSKMASEDAARTRSPPVVRIDTTPRGPRASQISDWSKNLPETPEPRTAPAQQGPAVPAQPKAPPQIHTLPVTTPRPAAPTPTPAARAPLPTPAPPMIPRAQLPASRPVVLPAVTQSDPAVVALLAKLVEQVDQMTVSQTQMAKNNTILMEQLSAQRDTAEQQRQHIQELQTAPKTQPQARPDYVPANVSIPSEPSTRAQKYYAVARGRTTGVFTRWKDAEKSVKGFSGAIHKRFKTEDAAMAWIRTKRSGWTDDASEISGDLTQGESDTVYGVGRPGGGPAATHSRASAILDLGHVGPDPSVGNPNEIHGTGIQIEGEILKLLCPKGVTATTRKDMIDAAPDVLALPGKLGSALNDSTEVWDQFAGAVSEIAEQRATRAGTQLRDTQWKVAGRNAIDKIKSAEDLFDAADELGSQSDKVLQSFEASLQEILYGQGWSKEDVELFIALGLLPRIVQRLIALYYEMYLHFQRLVVRDPDPDHFKDFILLHIEYHARQLRQIRMYAVRRSQMIFRSYTYLRDAKAKGFTDIRLIGIITQKLQELTRGHPGSEARPIKAKEWACNHCHSEIHDGGPAVCPLKDVKAKAARRIAKEVDQKQKEEPEILARLLAAEKAKV